MSHYFWCHRILCQHKPSVQNAASRDAAFGVTINRLYAQWGITCARWNAITKLHGLRWAGGSDAFAHAPPRTDTAARLAEREAGYYAYTGGGGG